jgi:aryl-alcohol dehydrogenase-like predicted oxidoreductase
MGVIPWAPLASGWLSGRWRKGAEPGSTRAERLRPSVAPLCANPTCGAAASGGRWVRALA